MHSARPLLFLLALSGFIYPAAAQSVLVPAQPEAEVQKEEVQIDPTTGFRRAPGYVEPAPTVNWDPPPDPDPNMPFYRSRGEIQRQLTMQMAAACRVKSIRVQLDLASFKDHFPAQQNVVGYMAAMEKSLTNLCADARTQLFIDHLLSNIQVVNVPGMIRPQVIGDTFTVTLSYDFAAVKPMDSRILTPEVATALEQLIKQYQVRTSYANPPRQDEDE